MPVEQLVRKWRTTDAQIESLRQQMKLGRYGGWLRS